MNKVEEVKKWAEFFLLIRQDVLDRLGEDIAEDADTMYSWFSALYMSGYNEARLRNLLDKSGVEEIEGYLKTLED